MRQVFFSAPLSLLLSLLALLLAGPFLSVMAKSGDQGHGRVNMQGSIIDTPCAIDVESWDQTIDMTAVPVGRIVRDGYGPEKPFHIRLINCSLPRQKPGAVDWSKFQVTFDGASTRDDLFSVSGEARGVGLRITDSQGGVAVPGEPMPTSGLLTDGMQLDYTLRLMSNRQSLRPGAYRTTIRFKLDYF